MTSEQNSPRPERTHSPPPKEAPAEVTLRSSDLLQGQREVLIIHGNETYRLRLTRNGKLILHK